MRVLIVYESIYGNTRAVAEAIAEGLGTLGAVELKSVYTTADSDPHQVDLLVVGGPTHMHGLTSSLSRRLAIQAGEEDGVELEDGARDKRGLRQWLSERSGEGRKAAAFDTRLDRSPTLTGVAARGIARRLHGCGYDLVAEPESFLVEDAEGPLAPGELERARGWGAELAATVQPKPVPGAYLPQPTMVVGGDATVSVFPHLTRGEPRMKPARAARSVAVTFEPEVGHEQDERAANPRARRHKGARVDRRDGR